jgi:ABC-type uncharacterized transport system involved in gliding motility auxiliary subunit
MANETGAAAFARDLGYLDKFFTNLNAHADTLAPAQGQRLKQLMAEEVVRWKEIRQLIAGQGGEVPAQTSVATTTAKPPAPAPSPVAAVPAEPQPRKSEMQQVSFTVGSLLGQPKK